MFGLLNETFVDDKYDKINIVVSRGWAKTTTGDLSLTVWAKCYKKSKFTVIGAKTDNDAQQFISSISNVFKTNKKIINTFGLLVDDRRKDLKCNANEIELTNETTGQVVYAAEDVPAGGGGFVRVLAANGSKGGNRGVLYLLGF